MTRLSTLVFFRRIITYLENPSQQKTPARQYQNEKSLSISRLQINIPNKIFTLYYIHMFTIHVIYILPHDVILSEDSEKSAHKFLDNK